MPLGGEPVAYGEKVGEFGPAGELLKVLGVLSAAEVQVRADDDDFGGIREDILSELLSLLADDRGGFGAEEQVIAEGAAGWLKAHLVEDGGAAGDGVDALDVA